MLQEADLVSVTKGYEGNRPHTSCVITAAGQKQFLDYVSVLEQVVRDAGNLNETSQPSGAKPKLA